jgi:hypothetical protein
MSLELIAEFDPFLAEYIPQYGNRGRGHVSYFSSTTYDELIEIMAKKVFNTIVSEIKRNRYYLKAHVDQLFFIIRSVNSDGKPVKCFLGFKHNVGHKAEQLIEAGEFETWDIDIKDCRGQSFDNASKMSGAYNSGL